MGCRDPPALRLQRRGNTIDPAIHQAASAEPQKGVYRIYYDAHSPGLVRGGNVRLMYTELHARSAFSFLEGASIPEELAGACAEQGMGAMALLDRDGVYGAPRFHLAAKKLSLQAHIGAEVTSSGRLALCLARGEPRRIPKSLPPDHADEIAARKKAKAAFRRKKSPAAPPA